MIKIKFLKDLLLLMTFAFLLSSCKEVKNSSAESDLELKKKDLELKEKELAIRERELDNKNSAPAESLNDGVPGYYPQVSLVKLTDADLQNLNAWDLRIMRNEVFARHGHDFKIPELRDYFLAQSWYVSKYEDVNGLLTDLERENIEMIRRYEEYTDSKYKGYSRC